MSKAEDFAIKKYPVSIEDVFGHKVDVNLWQRKACVDGYKQAEKDLKLGWEDMMLIHRCIKDAMNFHLYKMMEGVEGQKIVYQEVLKRFKELKESNEKK